MIVFPEFYRGFRSGVFRSGFPVACLTILIAATLLTGCASRKEILRFQEDSMLIQAKLDTINLNLQNLRMQADGLQIRQDRLVEEMVTQSDLRQFKAYTGSRMDDYESQGLMISAQINDLSQRLTGVVQQMDQLRYQPVQAPVQSDTITAADTVAAEIPVGSQPELKELYDQAYSDLTRGNYDLAKMGFEEYLRLYPDTELADNALYWMGETEYVQHNYEPALAIFQKVKDDYPLGNKVPAALFKIGLCQTALTLKDDAIATFQELIQLYPATPEASQANDRLAEME